jgi:hypothetical protein
MMSISKSSHIISIELEIMHIVSYAIFAITIAVKNKSNSSENSLSLKKSDNKTNITIHGVPYFSLSLQK